MQSQNKFSRICKDRFKLQFKNTQGKIKGLEISLCRVQWLCAKTVSLCMSWCTVRALCQ